MTSCRYTVAPSPKSSGASSAAAAVRPLLLCPVITTSVGSCCLWGAGTREGQIPRGTG